MSELACNFCAKQQKEVAKLIAGPDVHICDGCLALSLQVVLETDPDFLRRSGIFEMDKLINKDKHEYQNYHMSMSIVTGSLYWQAVQLRKDDESSKTDNGDGREQQ